MKLVAVLMLMMAIGLSGVYSQPIDDDAVSADDFFEIDGEIVDMDDALHKYRMLKVLSRIIAEEEAKDLLNPKKRFIADTFKKIKDALMNAVREAGQKVANLNSKIKGILYTNNKDRYNKAKAAVKKVSDKIDFDAVVKKIIPYINSGMSVGACVTAISAVATAILGPLASLIGIVAKPLCDGAFIKLEELAG